MSIQHRESAHLVQEDRIRIETLKKEGYTLRAIARSLNIDVSVISRECIRNKNSIGEYSAAIAQKKTDARRHESKHGARKLENNLILGEQVATLLRADCPRGDWSPEVIANTALKGKISHTSIYVWIKRSRTELRVFLPHQGRRRIKYGAKKARKIAIGLRMPSIDLRPVSAQDRKEIGHFEGDTVVLKEGRIHTLVERKSRFLVTDFIRTKGPGLALDVSASAVTTLKQFPTTHRRTITYDRGSEFSWWDETEKYLQGTKIYFAHPYHPWERGTNERTNGLIRRYFPKGEKFALITNDDVAKVVWRLNHRPRKILQWRTPCDVFEQCCSSRCN
jgi:transposase, IS30 family